MKLDRLLALLLSLVLLACNYSPAEITPPSGLDLPAGWTYKETDNYIIASSNKDAEKAKKLCTNLEKLHSEQVKLIPPNTEVEKDFYNDQKRVKLIIRYFGDRDSFCAWLVKRWPNYDCSDSIAIYDLELNQIYLYFTGWMKETNATLYHECTHQYLHNLMGWKGVNIPSWINEGVAEYFFAAGMETQDKIIMGTIHKSSRDTVKAEIRRKEAIPVSYLITMSDEKFDTFGARIYCYAWSLVHFMLNSKNKQYNAVIPKYFMEMQAITMPIIKKLLKKGVNFDRLIDYINDLIEKEKSGKLNDEESDDFNETYRMVKELRNAHKTAHERAFDKIDIDKLQKEWEEYFR